MKEKIYEFIKKFWFPIFLTVLVNLYQGATYYLAKLTPFPTHIVGEGIEKSIPFFPSWVIFYVLWHPLLILVPCYLYSQNKKDYYWYLTSKFLVDTVAAIIFFFYPTLLIRPDFQVTGLFTWMLSIVYWGDNPALNCFPSIHCTTCFAIIFILIKSNKIKKSHKAYGISLAVLIILSTLFVKQHAIIDIIGSFLLSLSMLWIVKKFSLESFIEKKFEKEKEA